MDDIEANFSLPKGRQIRGARAVLGFTQEFCAKKAGVSLSSYKRYEAIADNETILLIIKYSTVISTVDYFQSCGIQFGNSDQTIYLSFSQSKAVAI